MAGAFQYKPKFVDIRVRPPSKEEAAQTDDVYALKPGERACDHPGCRVAATARAPKSRDMLNEHYWFCQPHAAEYNRNWNFFAGMSEGEIKQRQAQSAQGDRPTWTSRPADSPARPPRPPTALARARVIATPSTCSAAATAAPGRPMPRDPAAGELERNALADLDLDRERRRSGDPRPLHRAGEAHPPR